MKLGLPAGVAAAAYFRNPRFVEFRGRSAQTQNIPQVPGDDIFGFTSPTEGPDGTTGAGLGKYRPAGARRAVLRPQQD
jgi:hypothetical protein